MNSVHDLLVDDLAAHWTEPTLASLKAAGIQPISVDMEIETWQALRQVLQAELRWQRAFESSTVQSLRTLMNRVLRKAALQVIRQWAPHALTAKLLQRLHGLVSGHRASAAERVLYAELVRQPALREAFKEPSRTDYFPRLRAIAV